MRFLLITQKYPPDIDASSNIVSYLAEQLYNNGHNIDVLTQGGGELFSKQGNIMVYRAKPTYWQRFSDKMSKNKSSILIKICFIILSYLRKVYLSLHLFEFPNSDPITTKRMLKIYEKKLEKKKYDCIISFFRPFTCLDVANKIKKKYSIPISIPIYFDLVENKDCPSLMPNWLYTRLIIKGDHKIFESSSKAFLPVSARKANNIVFQENKEKIIYYEFPTFIKKSTVKGKRIDKNGVSSIREITFVFAGTLNSNFRNPLKTLRLLNQISIDMPNVNFILQLYGGGDSHSIIDSFQSQENLTIIQNGRVSKADADNALIKSDFLINITNSYNSIVPSKIFELFASCKPIINIVNNGDDGSLQYFERYPLCFNAIWNTEKEFLYVAELLRSFIKNNIYKMANYDEVYSAFHKCTPEYMTDTILNCINELNCSNDNNYNRGEYLE